MYQSINVSTEWLAASNAHTGSGLATGHSIMQLIVIPLKLRTVH